MSDNCTHDCSSCGESCSERDLSAHLNAQSSVKKVIAVMSGKGGVGKSLVTCMLAVAAARQGFRTAILDADITGPSIPKAFGLDGGVANSDNGLLPAKTVTGIEVMSINLLLENTTDPVVWRGPVIGGAVTQFWTDVLWQDIDYMFVDMPPGTGDVPLTVFQSLPVDGIIVVTSPQELVSMIVSKAVNMAKLMKKPIIGLVENMSYFECPDCGKRHEIFGRSHIDQVANEYGLEILAKLPIDPKISFAIDNGAAEMLDTSAFDDIFEKL